MIDINKYLLKGYNSSFLFLSHILISEILKLDYSEDSFLNNKILTSFIYDSSYTLQENFLEYRDSEDRKTFETILAHSLSFDFIEKVGFPYIIRYNSMCIDFLLYLHQPRIDPLDNTKILLYRNLEDFNKKKLSSLKMGKAFKILNPISGYADQWVEGICDEYKEIIAVRNLVWELEYGGNEENFQEAYTLPVIKSSLNGPPATGMKNLANSCMQKTFPFKKHPTVIYATEDFEIAYLTTIHKDKKKIGARVLLNIPSKTYSYIYAATKTVGEQLKKEINKLGYTTYFKENSTSFIGSKLQYIPIKSSSILAPYIDYDNDVYDRGWGGTIEDGYIIITHEDNGDFSFCSTEGYISLNGRCHRCDNYLDDDYCSYCDESDFYGEEE